MKNKIVIILSGIFLILGICITSYAYKNNLQEEKTILIDEELDRSLEIYNGNATVCIDPGHGGEVPFDAPDLQEIEKEDVLDLCLLLRDELIKRKVNVIMTRDDDTSLELEERAKIANDAGVDLFLSLHRNISDVGSDINGVEIWCALNKGDEEDVYANYIHDAIVKSHIQNDRGIKYGSQTNCNVDYIVNRETVMPSMIIEFGFMTNEEDNRLFKAYMDEYAENLAKGIIYTLENIND